MVWQLAIRLCGVPTLLKLFAMLQQSVTVSLWCKRAFVMVNVSAPVQHELQCRWKHDVHTQWSQANRQHGATGSHAYIYTHMDVYHVDVDNGLINAGQECCETA